MNSRDGLYFKFKRLLFDTKKVLLDDKGREKLPKDFDMVKIRGLLLSIYILRDELINLLDMNPV